MRDPFTSLHPGLSDPGSSHVVLKPNDDADIDPVPRALWIATAGDVAIRDAAGTDLIYRHVPVGVFPFRPVRLLEATTATVIGWR